jgi:hypothetical protein
MQLSVQMLEPAGAAVPQPVPIWQGAPCAQAVGTGGGGGGGGGGQDTLHWKCPPLSQKHEFVHPLGVPPPQPSLALHGAPGVKHVLPVGTEEVPGGQVSVTQLPLTIA